MSESKQNKEVEKELALFSENKSEILETIFNASVEGLMITDADGFIIKTNPRIEEMFGYEQGELISQKIEVLIPDALRHKHVHRRESFIENPAPRSMGLGKDFPALHKDGHLFLVEVSLNTITYEGKRFALAFITDITKRKEAENKLLKQKELLKYFVTHTPSSVAMLDKDLKYLIVSDRFIKDFNTTSDIIGKNRFEVFLNFKGTLEKELNKVLQGKVIEKREDQFPLKDNTFVWMEWEAHPWRDDQGEIGGIIIFAVNITDRKAAEEVMRENQFKLQEYNRSLESKNKELENFAYVSSHDLQEPLRKIRAFGDRLLVKERASLSDKGKDYLDRMLNSAERMQQLIDDLLTFSRVTSKERMFEYLDLNMIMKNVLSDLEFAIEQSSATINWEPLPTISGDATQIRQLFQNLLSNSIKFRREDVPLEVKITARVFDINDNQLLELKFSDNGIGFDKKYTEKIFNIFQRLEGRKFEGSGIGLAICKKIAQRHGGDIEAEGVENEGATFTVQLQMDNFVN